MEILVSICCTTYNHEKYIRDTIEGFLIQKTTFPIEIIIHDDASTDKTATIVKEYADKNFDLIIPILQKENQWSKGIRPSPAYVWPLARGKYIAICEGDDYWTDPYKLQKQVDFLESKNDFGAVFTHAMLYYENKNLLIPKNDRIINRKFKSGNVFLELLKTNPYVTCTVLFKSSFLEGWTKIITNFKWKQGDYPLWLYISQYSKIGYISDTTSVYRILSNSVSHLTSLEDYLIFKRSTFRIFFFYNGTKELGWNRIQVRRKYLDGIIEYIISNNFFIKGSKYINLSNADLILKHLLKKNTKNIIFMIRELKSNFIRL